MTKTFINYTWHRDSLGQRFLIDFFIVSVHLFSSMSDARVKRGAELPTVYNCLHFEILEKTNDILITENQSK